MEPILGVHSYSEKSVALAEEERKVGEKRPSDSEEGVGTQAILHSWNVICVDPPNTEKKESVSTEK